MTPSTRFPRLAVLAAALIAISGVQAAPMSDGEMKAAKDRIEAQYKADKASCDSLSGNAKDICGDEAEGKEKVAKAELQYQHSGTTGDRRKVAEARAEAAYEVAKEKCDDRSGNAKDVCVKEAQAAKVKAEADAKVASDTTATRSGAAQDVRDADYKVAVEKCDSLAGDAKTSCVTNAKTRYGKD